MSIKKIADRIENMDCSVSIKKDSLEINSDGITSVTNFDKKWISAINGFYKARQYHFHYNDGILTGNRFAEYYIIRIDPGFYYRTEHKFEGNNGDTIFISPASKEFMLSFFKTDAYLSYFSRLKERIKRRHENTRMRGRQVRLRPDELFPSFHTIRFKPKKKPSNTDICQLAEPIVKSCLFSLAFKKDEVWELYKEIKSQGIISPRKEDNGVVLNIPKAKYNNRIVTYYKLAKSSRFPSQVYLSYYHILEYFFLRIADELLHRDLRMLINDPSFDSNYNNISRLIATLKKSDSSADETRMLKAVLQRHVSEEEFIAFILDLETKTSEQFYSKDKHKILGETFPLKLKGGHALSNTATILKYIRNAIVHSSDRHTHEECFIPFSESEDIVVRFIPVIQFLAEKIIFATAQ